MFAARVCISTGFQWWAGPPWDFGSSQALIPSVLLRASDLYLPPAVCLTGDLPSPDGMTLGGDAGLIGGQEPLAQQRHRCPGARCAYLPSPFRAQACSTH